MSYLRDETAAATPPRLGNGRRLFVARPTGHVDRELLITGVEPRPELVYRYDRRGLVVEIAGRDTVRRYLYDARGRLQFVRSYVLAGRAWTLIGEVELEHTDEGSDTTFAGFTEPLEQWRLDYYGRGDILDRYRR